MMGLQWKALNKVYLSTITAVLFLFFSASAFASQYKIYTLDNLIEAPFPGVPEDIGIINNDGQKYQGYNYVDNQSGLLFTSTLQKNKVVYSSKTIDRAIDSFINGSAIAMNGKVAFKSLGEIAGNRGAYFKITMTYQGVKMHKSAAVLYEGGHFYTWSVIGQDDVLVTSTFNKYVKYFKMVSN
ncbi:hypothetical protein ITG09_06795 [Vibrio cyclitrophicus]|nr:hypothetical protein [Vibrio cyclitrophicus]UPR53325.1 hypothetical protein ITG09_06795 [Vibrio cyclitrophicus]